ncbi:hypothetical protein SAMN05421831_101439 [Allopseudospirillum japonicum]|uniref:Uncharacterized protein n=1 Tax=Allopseudospirillum japonicum TaxID=64971 RepID=A0A1H6QPL2_9GAMM|nr:hypothetical protein [Allopseudospirillum japonicum]SEI42167.1 hypothetical protein SAMN05421831_101439 [Allopseudospirillum japonicum]
MRFVTALSLCCLGGLVPVFASANNQATTSEATPAPSWLDSSRAYMYQQLNDPILGFDRFFANQRSDEYEYTNKNYFRWRNEIDWSERDDWRFRTRLYASVRLPHLSERVRLLTTRDEDIRGEFTEDDPSGKSSSVTRTRLALRWLAAQTERSETTLEGGLEARFPPDPYAIARHRYQLPLTDTQLTRWTQSLFWRLDEKLGTQTRLDWEWQWHPQHLLRLTGTGTYYDEDERFEWASSLGAYTRHGPQEGVGLELGAFGSDEPQWVAEEYYVHVKYRRSFLRPWLFYELQPEYAWVAEDRSAADVVYDGDWRFTLKLEVHLYR